MNKLLQITKKAKELKENFEFDRKVSWFELVKIASQMLKTKSPVELFKSKGFSVEYREDSSVYLFRREGRNFVCFEISSEDINNLQKIIAEYRKAESFYAVSNRAYEAVNDMQTFQQQEFNQACKYNL